jgi:DNA-binding SARP family transcriptional activator/predicted ATPase
MLEIRLLGQFEIRRDGEPIRIGARKAQSLLALLLLKRGRRHRREQLAGLLWPEMEEAKARDRLRYALWQLREKIGNAYISADRISLGFDDNSDYWLDVAALEQGNPAGNSLEELAHSASAYQGELLPGFYEDWVILERERLRALFERQMDALLQQLVAAGDWGRVAASAERWISLGQIPEPAYRALMIACAKMGDTFRAVSAYERCATALQDGLAVAPSQETREIYERILAGDELEDLDTSQATAPGASAPRTTAAPPWQEPNWGREVSQPSLFVGRERELGILNDALTRALEGRGGVFFIRGRAGAGKTALWREFSRRALEKSDELVITYGSGEAQTGSGDPHLLFRDALALLTGDLERQLAEDAISLEAARRLWSLLPQSIEALLELGPSLIGSLLSGPALLKRAERYSPDDAEWLAGLRQFVGALGDVPAPINIQHRDLQGALFDQYAQTLLRLSQHRPLLLVLDDLQWADPGSISLLFHLGRRLSGYRILVLGCYRPDESAVLRDGETQALGRVVTEFRRQFGEIELDLDEIGERDRRLFVDSILDAETNRLGEEFREALFRHTGGHALFTVELLQQLQKRGDLTKNDEGSWVQRRQTRWDALPARIEAVIQNRIDPLPSRLKEVLRIASVEGEEFTAEVVAGATGQDLDSVLRDLSHELGERHSLVRAIGLQRVHDQGVSRYRFRHHLFQDYVYRSLDPIIKAHSHLRVGEALERLYGDGRGEIAHRLARHFEAAGRAEKAIDYCLAAAEKAKRQSANKEAITHLRSGLRLLEDISAGRGRTRRELALRIAISAPLVATEGYTAPEVESTLGRARLLCERVDDRSQLGTALWGLWSYYLVRAKHSVARGLAGEIHDLVNMDGMSELDLVAHWTIGISDAHLGELRSAHDHLAAAISLYDPERHHPLTYLYGQNPAATCRIYSAFNLWLLGHPERAERMCRSALDLGEGIEHPFSLAFVHAMAAIFHALRQDADSAHRHSQQAVALSRKSGFPFLLSMGLTTRGWARAAMGKSSMTIRPMRKGIEAMDTIGSELGRPIFLFLLAEAYARSGQIQQGMEAVERGLQYARQNREQMYLADLLRLRAELLQASGRPAQDVGACFSESLAVARRQDAKWLQLRTLSSMVASLPDGPRREKARRELAALLPWFEEGFATPEWMRAQELASGEVPPSG